MKKILSILLIIFMLSASLITIPVNAKILNDGDDSWVWEIDTFTDGGVINEDATYETLEEYLNVHYIDYADLGKSDITTIWLADDANTGASGRYSIKDLSGLYDFPNLKNLVLWKIDNETTQAALDALDFSRLTNLEKLYIGSTKIKKLEIGELINLTYLEINNSMNYTSVEEFYIDLDLSKMNNLGSFNYYIFDIPEVDMATIGEEIKSYITPMNGYEVYYTGNVDGRYLNFSMAESVNFLNINVSTDKTKYTVGEPVLVTVNWNKPLQATEFILHFDSSTLEFVRASIGEDFYDTSYLTDGEIPVSWAEFNEADVYEMTFLFNAIAESNGHSAVHAGISELATGELVTEFLLSGTTFTEITIEATDYVKDDAAIQTDYKNIGGKDLDLLLGLQLTDNKVTLQDLLNLDAFDDGINVKAYKSDSTEISSIEGLGTGSVIKLYKGEELVRELNVVVYGDLSGDGEITALDALTIIKARNNKITVSDICLEAGRVFNKQWDGGPSAVDALAIIKHLNNKYEIQQTFYEA